MFNYLTHLTPVQESKVWLGFAALAGWCLIRAGLWVWRTWDVPARVAVWQTNQVVDGTIVEQSTEVVGRHGVAEHAATADTYRPAHNVTRRVLEAPTTAFRAIAADAGHPVHELGPREGAVLPFTRTETAPPQSVLMSRWARHYLPTLTGGPAEQLSLPLEDGDGDV